jgi:hypothetical protein
VPVREREEVQALLRKSGDVVCSLAWRGRFGAPSSILTRVKLPFRSSRLLPNVAVMPVLGISPCGILRDLAVCDFQGYPFGDLQAACDGRRFRELAAEVPGYFSRLVGFGVDPDSDRKSSVVGKPILRGSALLPHSRHFRFLPVLPVPKERH